MITRTTLRNNKNLLCFFAGCLLVLIILSATPSHHMNRTRLGMANRHPDATNDDYNRLMNMTDFKFLTKRDCPKEPVTLLIMVHSSPDNFQKRQVIRETWGHHQMSIEIRFVVGSFPEPGIMWQVHKEHEVYGDIVQGNFIDSYHNLTYKYVSVLKYVVYHCSHADYILKTDDDVFVNVPYLMEFLKFFRVESNKSSGNDNLSKKQDLLMCSIFRGNVPIRETNSKWYVSETEYKDDVFPDHCSGFWALFTADVVEKLYTMAQVSDYFWVDDVFVTGILVKKLGLKHVEVDFGVMKSDVQKALFEGKVVNEPPKFLFGDINMQADQIKALWKYIQSYWPVSK